MRRIERARHFDEKTYLVYYIGKGRHDDYLVHVGLGDAFVSEWQAFHDNIMNRTEPKTSPADFR